MSVRIGHQDEHVTVLYPDPINPRCLYISVTHYQTTPRGGGVTMNLYGPRGGNRSTKWSKRADFITAAEQLAKDGFAIWGHSPGMVVRLIIQSDDLVSLEFFGPRAGHHGKAMISLADFISIALTVGLPSHAVPLLANDLAPQEAFHARHPSAKSV